MTPSPLADQLGEVGKRPEPFDIIEGAQPPLRPLHLVVRETEFCGQRLAGDFSRRMRENGRNSVRRPRHASVTDRNCEGFCRPGNRVGLHVLYGGRRSSAEPVSGAKFPANREKNREFGHFSWFKGTLTVEKVDQINDLRPKFPKRASREFIVACREFLARHSSGSGKGRGLGEQRRWVRSCPQRNSRKALPYWQTAVD